MNDDTRVVRRLESLGRRSLPWPGVVFLVVIALLALSNIYVIYRNFRDYSPVERPARRSTKLMRLTAANPQDSVRWGFTLLYELRQLHGATLIAHPTIPLDMFLVEHVSRLRVEPTGTRLQISEDSVKRLWEQVTLWGRVDGETQMILIARPGVTRYVATAVDGNPSAFFILPAELYAQEAEPGHTLEAKR